MIISLFKFVGKLSFAVVGSILLIVAVIAMLLVGFVQFVTYLT